jgi:hypothetical protein
VTADVLLVLAGRVDAPLADRVLREPQVRGVVTAAWATRPPTVELLARALRLAAHGKPELLNIVRELHLDEPGSARRRTSLVLVALHHYVRRVGHLRFFTEVATASLGWHRVTSSVASSTTSTPALRLTTDGDRLVMTGSADLVGIELTVLVADEDGGHHLLGPARAERGRRTGTDAGLATAVLPIGLASRPVLAEVLHRPRPAVSLAR